MNQTNEFYIGNVHIPSRVALGPMAGVTDLPFRLLCKEMGAGLLYTEMISAKGIFYGNKNTNELWATCEEDSPLALQLFGSDPVIMADMAKKIEDMDFDILDINMGCPVPKVVNNGEGSALMKNPALAAKIVKSIKKAISKPVTVKFRKGFDANNVNAVEFAKVLEDAGADALCVHGRTRSEYYSGTADYDIIRSVKESVSIPVIASGDIFKAVDVFNCLDYTNADAVIVARGARGNPWIFRDANRLLSGEITYEEALNLSTKPDKEELKAMILRHARDLIKFKGEYTGIHEMRKHFTWYVSGIKGSAALRGASNHISSYEELEEICDRI